MKADISAVDPGTAEYEQLANYVASTHGSTHRYRLKIANAYRIGKPVELSSRQDRRLLFHGSRTTNMLSILTNGLRLPTESQVVNGAMFAPGIYLANSVTKSFNYCSSEKGLVLVCEAALGRSEVVYQPTSHRPGPEYDSRFAPGRWTPGHEVPWIVDGQIKVPLGPLQASALAGPSSLQYDEFILYRPNMYQFRYLLELDRE